MPKADQTSANARPQTIAAKKAFQRLWVAGALGVFFTSLAKSIAADVATIGAPVDWVRTLANLLRYVYLILLLTYFFGSNLRTQSLTPPERRGVLFDVMQSVCSITAVFYLDFLIPSAHSPRVAYLVANVAFLIFAVVPMVLFPNDGMQAVRIIGAGAAAGSLILVALISNTIFLFASLLLPIGILSWALTKFLLFRIATMPVDNNPASDVNPQAIADGQ
ncbi:MAG TPA: hypothetical protein VGK01_19990 [Candidatus Angelobacter sp.]|jgi:hypothetical protein